jgi:hypothetical protein
MKQRTINTQTKSGDSNLRKGEFISGTLNGEKYSGKILRITTMGNSISYLVKDQRRFRTLTKRILTEVGNSEDEFP